MAGVVRLRADGLGHARQHPLGTSRRLRKAQATSPVEVGDGDNGRQAGQRYAVQMAPAARHSRASEAEALRVPRRSVQLSGVAVSSEADGECF